MKKNVGKIDMIVRLLIGFGIGAAGLYFNTWWGLLGIIPVMTAFVGFCGLYTLFGISTCPRQRA